MATEDTAPKRSGLGWIPKLSLWAVVIAFGYLYLSSLDRDTTGDTTQVAVAEESGVEAEGFQKLVDTLGDLTASAETVIADVTAAGANGFNKVVDKVKDLTGSAETERAETSVPDAAPSAVAKAEPIAAEPVVVEASPAPQEPAAKPAPMQVSEDRPAASAFNRHSAPLPATAAARATSPEPVSEQVSEPTSQQVSEVTLEETAPAVATTAAPPMKDAEATVFAESLMGGEPASGSADVAAPMSAPITQGFAPVPVMP